METFSNLYLQLLFSFFFYFGAVVVGWLQSNTWHFAAAVATKYEFTNTHLSTFMKNGKLEKGKMKIYTRYTNSMVWPNLNTIVYNPIYRLNVLYLYSAAITYREFIWIWFTPFLQVVNIRLKLQFMQDIASERPIQPIQMN